MKGIRKRFRKEFFVQRKKDYKGVLLVVEDVVVIGSDNRKRSMWPMGVVLEVTQGRDGVVMVCKVKLRISVLTRSIQRLYPLELQQRLSRQEDAV